MRIRVDADVAPVVMQGAMDCMMLALTDERPLSDLERLGWLVVCQHIADRLPKDSKDNETT